MSPESESRSDASMNETGDSRPGADADEDRSIHGRRLARLGSLVGGFAHEIKNPLSTIGLNLRLMEEELTEPLSPREARILKRSQRLSKEVVRLQGILDDFLNYVRAPKPRLEVISLNDFIRELADLVGPGMEKQGLTLHVYLHEGLLPLRADPSLLHQAVLNLLTNAQESLSEVHRRGEVIVSTGLEEDGRHQTLAVIDSGPGMNAETRRRCFQPYFSTKRGGTGLGLAIARRLVEDQGGDIRVETEEGAGTRFIVRLPATGTVKGDGRSDVAEATAGGEDT